jgi:hypothetical protein
MRIPRDVQPFLDAAVWTKAAAVIVFDSLPEEATAALTGAAA